MIMIIIIIINCFKNLETKELYDAIHTYLQTHKTSSCKILYSVLVVRYFI